MAGRRVSTIRTIVNARRASIRARPASDGIALPRALRIESDARLGQATALFRAGASLAARRMLDAISHEATIDSAGLSSLALALEIDADLGVDRSSEHRARWSVRRARSLDAKDAAQTDAGHAWIDASTALRRNDRRALRSTFERVATALRARAMDDVAVRALLAHFCADLVPALVEVGDRAAALAAIDEAAALVAGRDDVPADVRALVHINRAFVFAASPENLGRSMAERELARNLAVAHGLPRVLWKCLYLREFERIWCGDVVAALDDARTLSASVDASDSTSWRRIARSQLSNAYTAGGDYIAAESTIAQMTADHVTDAALHASKLAYLQGRDAEAIARSEALISYGSVPASVCANALLYSAGAAYRLADRDRAANDIDHAIALFESSSMPALFIFQRVNALAHRITGRKRFRDVALEIQAAFDHAHRAAAATTPSAALTTRQREIAELAAAGATTRAIAGALGISPRTVGNHLGAAFEVLDVRARWQLRDALCRFDER